jgi:hypothetical protein
MTQVLKIKTDQWDGAESEDGQDFREWLVHYVVYRQDADKRAPLYQVWEEDDRGSGKMIAEGNTLAPLRSMLLMTGDII